MRVASLFFVAAACALVVARPASAEEACTAPSVAFEALTAALEKDSQVKAMKPWVLASVVMAPCVAPDGNFGIDLTFHSSASSLGLQYQTELELTVQADKLTTVVTEPSIAKRRGVLDKAMRAAEKHDFIAELIKQAPSIGARIDADGRIEYFVPDWGSEPAAVWEAERLSTIRLPFDYESTQVSVQAFKAIVPELVEGKACSAPEAYTARYDADARSWTFDFDIAGTCAGKWTVRVALDGGVEVSKR